MNLTPCDRLLGVYARLSDDGSFSLDIVSVALIMGVLCFLVGIYGIVSGVKGLRS